MRPPRLEGGGRGGRTREVMTRVFEGVAKNGRKRMNVPTLRMLFREKHDSRFTYCLQYVYTNICSYTITHLTHLI